MPVLISLLFTGNRKLLKTIVKLQADPLFWNREWMVLLAVLLAAGIGAFIWIKLSRKVREQEHGRKMAESELQSLRLSMNPHFIFNSLSSLQSFILTNRNEDASIFIAKFSKLIRSVMNYSLRGEMTLEEEMELLSNYLELERVRFGDHFEFEISSGAEINRQDIIIPSLLIQPFVENAIKYRLSGKKQGKDYIHIRFMKEGEQLFCIIEDNGKEYHLPGNKKQLEESSGIRITEERIKFLVNDPEKKVIERIKETAGDLTRTRVKILIPLLKEVKQKVQRSL
jgi:LytS/YehU family sensor histidine kinase